MAKVYLVSGELETAKNLAKKARTAFSKVRNNEGQGETYLLLALITEEC
jgi:hypothetical protein